MSGMTDRWHDRDAEADPGAPAGAAWPAGSPTAPRFPALSPEWGDEVLDEATLARMARALTASGRYRVVEQFERRDHYHLPQTGAAIRRALFVDVETTGLDPSADAIIQFAAVPFSYCPHDGRIFAVGECLTCLEDPGRPIPALVTRLTGLTDDDVCGRHLDEALIEALVAETDLVIAHNAGFDRRFLERRIPAFAERPWACSQREVPWQEEGLGSAKLEWLAYKHGGMYYQAHQADSDCYMAVHLLATPLPSGRPALAMLLERCRSACVRFWAFGAFEQRRLLKIRGYTFCGGEDGLPKAWWRDVAAGEARRETEWLREHVYGGCAKPAYQCVRVDARNRFSARVAPSLAGNAPIV